MIASCPLTLPERRGLRGRDVTSGVRHVTNGGTVWRACEAGRRCDATKAPDNVGVTLPGWFDETGRACTARMCTNGHIRVARTASPRVAGP
jgi:hypothetical protein